LLSKLACSFGRVVATPLAAGVWTTVSGESVSGSYGRRGDTVKSDGSKKG
jgi:hypothetical protein